MLIDPKLTSVDPVEEKIHEMISGSEGSSIQRHGPGLYQIGHWNFDSYLRGRWEKYPSLDEFGDFHAYGVCDNPSQFMMVLGGKLAAHPSRSFCVSLVQIKKSDAPPEGGWRWHKWGPYIGEQDPQCEYLYDEPKIEEVWTYHVYEKVG